MEKVVIVSCARTPIGAYGGSLKDVPVYRLASTVLRAAVERAHIDPSQVDDVIMGSAYQMGNVPMGLASPYSMPVGPIRSPVLSSTVAAAQG